MTRLARLSHHLFSPLRRYARDEGGNVFIIVGLSIFVLIAAAGSGVDLARSQIIQLKMHQSADAGALAAGSIPRDTVAEAQRTAHGRRYFSLNYPDNFMNSNITASNAEFQYDPDGMSPETVNVQVSSNSPNNFVSLVGDTNVAIASETEVAVTGGSILDVDVILVADGTGSMQGQKIANLKQGANAFVDSIYDPATYDPAEDKVRMAMIEYFAFGCRNNVTNPTKRDQGIRQNTPFTDNTTQLKGYINSFKATGCTDGGWAAKEGRKRLLTAPPRISDNQKGAKQVWIFMTDGIFNTPSNSISEEDFAVACGALKAEGVTRYTIRYGGSGNKSLLRSCASDPKSDFFFDAPNPADIKTVFEEISLGIKSLLIVK